MTPTLRAWSCASPFGAIWPFANDSINFQLSGPAVIIGDNPFALIGGTGAIWIRAMEQPGTVKLTAMHPYLGSSRLLPRKSRRAVYRELMKGDK